MLEAIISSKTRIKLLLKFFLNPEASSYLRSLETEFGDSTNAIRVELNRFEKAGMLESSAQGNRRIFKANNKHPLFKEIRKIVMKHMGVDQIIDEVINRLGDIDAAYLTGKLAKGQDADVVDIVLVGDPDKNYLLELVEKAENLIKKKIRFLLYSPQEAKEKNFDPVNYILVWSAK